MFLVNKQKILAVITILAVAGLVFVAAHTQLTKNDKPNWSILISEEGVVFEGEKQPFTRIYVDKKKETYIFAADESVEQVEEKIVELIKEAKSAEDTANAAENAANKVGLQTN